MYKWDGSEKQNGKLLVEDHIREVLMARRLQTLNCLLLVLCALSTLANAGTVLYSNFGPGYSYKTFVGYPEFGPLSAPCVQYGLCQITGMQFTAPFTAALDRIDLAGGWISGMNSLTLQLAVDNNYTPGLILESWNLGPLGRFGDNNPPLTAISVFNPVLSAGVTYDIIALPANDWAAAWNDNDQGALGYVIWSLDNGKTWSSGIGTQGAFDVIATPECGTVVTLSTGIIGVVGVLRRKLML